MENNRTLLLLCAMLKASSRLNILKHTKDRKTRKRIISSMMGLAVLWGMMTLYLCLYAYGLVSFGMGSVLPALTAVAVSLVTFFLTLLKAGGYLFGFRDYDRLMSMPFKMEEIAAAKFLTMYCSSLFLTLSLSAAMLIGYGLAGNLTLIKGLMWIVLTPFLPVIPMLAASLVSILIAVLTAGFRYKTVLTALLTAAVMLPLMFSGYFVSSYFDQAGTAGVLQQTSGIITGMAGLLPGAGWFVQAVTEGSLLSFALMICIPVLCFVLFVLLVSRMYPKINARLEPGQTGKEKKAFDYKVRSVPVSIAFKDFKRMTSSSTYMVNVLFGVLIALIAGIAVLFVSPAGMLPQDGKESFLTLQMLVPAVPFVLYFFLGMAAVSVISPSIEGKNHWIVKSLPIEPEDDCKGKILLSLILLLPVGLFSAFTVSLSMTAEMLDIFLNLCMIAGLCFFASCYGLYCGYRHRNLDWEYEVEVIKQGPALMWYMFPNMILTVFLASVLLGLGAWPYIRLIQLAVILILFAASWLFWKKAVKTAGKLRD